MSSGWDNYEAAPLEFFHGRLMDLFHEYRKTHNQPIRAEIDGNGLNNLIAKAKTETYAKYPKQVNGNAILKTEI